MRRTIVLAVCFMTALVLTGCGKKKEDNKTMEDGFLTEVMETTRIDLSGCIGEEEGDHADGITYARFSVEEGKMPDIRAAVDGKLGEIQPVPEALPGYNGHEIANTMQEENMIGYWTTFADGDSGEKTRSVELYLTSDSKGDYFLYFFG